jgi:hypothetical protein
MRHVRTHQIFLTLIAFGCAPLLKEGNPRMTLKIGSAASSDRALGTGTSFSSDYCYALHIQGPNLYRVPPWPRDQACAHGPKGLGVLMGLYDAGSEASIEVTVGQRTIHLVGVKKSDIAGVDLSTCAGNVIGANVMPRSGPDQGDGPRVEMTINGVPVEPADSNSAGMTANDDGDDEGGGDIEMTVFAEANALLVPGNNNVAMQLINGGAGTEYGCRDPEENDPPSNNMQGPFVFPWPDGMCQPGNGPDSFCRIQSGMKQRLFFEVLCHQRPGATQAKVVVTSPVEGAVTFGPSICVGGRAKFDLNLSNSDYDALWTGEPRAGYFSFQLLNATNEIVAQINPEFVYQSSYQQMQKLVGSAPAPISVGDNIHDDIFSEGFDSSIVNNHPKIVGTISDSVFVSFHDSGVAVQKLGRFKLAHPTDPMIQLPFTYTGSTSLSDLETRNLNAGSLTRPFILPTEGLGFLNGAPSVFTNWKRFADPFSFATAPIDHATYTSTASGEFSESASSNGMIAHLRDIDTTGNYVPRFLINYAGGSSTNFSEPSPPIGTYSIASSGNVNLLAKGGSDPVYFSFNAMIDGTEEVTVISKCSARDSCTGLVGVAIAEPRTATGARSAFIDRGALEPLVVTLGNGFTTSMKGTILKLNTVSMATTLGTHISTQGASTKFSTFYPDWTSTPQVHDVAAIPFNQQMGQDSVANLVAVGSIYDSTIYANRSVIYRSSDNGENWYRVYVGPANTVMFDAHPVELRGFWNGQEQIRPGFAFVEGQNCPSSFCTGGFKIIHQSNHGF